VHYGYRRINVLLKREGWVVNAKRIYRLYRELGLQLRTGILRRSWRRAARLAPKANSPALLSGRGVDCRWLRGHKTTES